MKVTIIKKSIKEGSNARGSYCIKSLYVSFSDEATYNRIVAHLKKQGASDETIAKFCSPREYEGALSYAFGLNCSNFTFDAVQMFGVLDAKIDFKVNDNGFINARIIVTDKKEQVNGYEAPASEVDGWACGNPATATTKPEDKPFVNPVETAANTAQTSDDDDNDLPF